MIRKDLVIIGAGPAGLAAALEAKRMGIDDILVLEREMYAGGILNQCIHDGFGLIRFGESLTGPEYARRFIVKALKAGIAIETGAAVTAMSAVRELSVMSGGKVDGISRGCRRYRNRMQGTDTGCSRYSRKPSGGNFHCGNRSEPHQSAEHHGR